MAIAAKNLGSEYCMAPAAITKGTNGNGGGSSAGTKSAAKPQRSNVFRALSTLCFENFFARANKHGGDIHAAGNGDYRTIEEAEANQADSAEMQEPAGQVTCRRCDECGQGLNGC